jgi:hypothetical protein
MYDVCMYMRMYMRMSMCMCMQRVSVHNKVVDRKNSVLRRLTLCVTAVNKAS